MFHLKLTSHDVQSLHNGEQVDIKIRDGIYGYLVPNSTTPNCEVDGIKCEFNFYAPDSDDFEIDVSNQDRYAVFVTNTSLYHVFGSKTEALRDYERVKNGLNPGLEVVLEDVREARYLLK